MGGAKAIMKDQRLSYSSGKGFDQHQINTMAKKIKKTNDALSFDANMAKSWKLTVVGYRKKLAAAYASAAHGPNSPHVKSLQKKLKIVEGARLKECKAVLDKEARDEKIAKEKATKEKAAKEKKAKAQEKIAK